MNRIITLISMCSILTLIFTGCNKTQQQPEKPIWQDTKIYDLRPETYEDTMNIEQISFQIDVVEIPADDTRTIEKISKMLYTEPISFNSKSAFANNNFSAGFNQVKIIDSLNSIFHQTASKKIRDISLLIIADDTNHIYTKNLPKKQKIFYNSTEGSTEHIILGPGDLILEMTAKADKNTPGVCTVYFQPAFMPPLDTIPEISEMQLNKRFDFKQVGFKATMGPGDLIVLMPQKYMGHQISLGSLFFCDYKPIPVQKIYTIICTRLNF